MLPCVCLYFGVSPHTCMTQSQSRTNIENICIYIYIYIYIYMLYMYYGVNGALCSWLAVVLWTLLNSLRPRQNNRLFADDTFKRIFLNKDIRISTKNSLKFVHKGLINNIPALVLIMAWCRPGDKPLSEPMLVTSLTHICVTRPQWVNSLLLFIDHIKLLNNYLQVIAKTWIRVAL